MNDLKKDNRLMTVIIGVIISVTSTFTVLIVKEVSIGIHEDIVSLHTLPDEVTKLGKRLDEHEKNDSLIHSGIQELLSCQNCKQYAK